ncbi:MAG TPA: hypothetical protein VFS14_01700 [Candidatus Saccharimonadales bacterium]|nr:hypothetical protein [Candidatus Saccharimonadales bacterium]
MTEPTTERQTATTTTGTTGSTTSVAASRIEFTEADKLRIQLDAQRAVCGRPLRRRY